MLLWCRKFACRNLVGKKIKKISLLSYTVQRRITRTEESIASRGKQSLHFVHSTFQAKFKQYFTTEFILTLTEGGRHAPNWVKEIERSIDADAPSNFGNQVGFLTTEADLEHAPLDRTKMNQTIQIHYEKSRLPSCGQEAETLRALQSPPAFETLLPPLFNNTDFSTLRFLIHDPGQTGSPDNLRADLVERQFWRIRDHSFSPSQCLQ